MRRTISAPPRARGFTLVELPAVSRRERTAFTLVELLVVIGIIAVLISILLPSLSAARRQAAAAKCAAQMREIGTAFQMYAIDSKGWFPPAQLLPHSSRVYNVDGLNYPASGYGAYWFNFLSRYVTKSKVGLTGTTNDEAATARRSILWGCPSWDGYQSATLGGVNRLQVGFGMNAWPTHQSDYPTPPANHPPTSERVFIQNWGHTSQVGNFIKQVDWGKRGAERALVGDSLFWEIEAQRVLPSGMVGQALLTNTTAAGNHAFGYSNTLVDAYRHGKYPPPSGDGASFQKTGGIVGFNILYADGHVARAVDRTEAFRSLRMRYPE